MDAQLKIAALKDRLNKLSAREKDNDGVQRRIRREIRNLEKPSVRILGNPDEEAIG